MHTSQFQNLLQSYCDKDCVVSIRIHTQINRTEIRKKRAHLWATVWGCLFGLCWVLVASRGSPQLRCVGPANRGGPFPGGVSGPAQALGSQTAAAAACGSAVVLPRILCSAACRIFLDQGLNPCPLHQRVDSYPPYPPGKSWQLTFNKGGRTIKWEKIQCFQPMVLGQLDIYMPNNEAVLPNTIHKN